MSDSAEETLLRSVPDGLFIGGEWRPARSGATFPVEDPATGSITTFPTSLETGIIDFRAAITQAVEGGYTGVFLCEHYGGDSLGNIARNRDYIRSVLSTIL